MEVQCTDLTRSLQVPSAQDAAFSANSRNTSTSLLPDFFST
jgi:hypothetical protein